VRLDQTGTCDTEKRGLRNVGERREYNRESLRPDEAIADVSKIKGQT
jgi:hypothetical protein